MSNQDIKTELEQLGGVDNVMLSCNPSESNCATECESLWLYQLKMATPSSGSEGVMARACNKKRIAL